MTKLLWQAQRSFEYGKPSQWGQIKPEDLTRFILGQLELALDFARRNAHSHGWDCVVEVKVGSQTFLPSHEPYPQESAAELQREKEVVVEAISEGIKSLEIPGSKYSKLPLSIDAPFFLLTFQIG